MLPGWGLRRAMVFLVVLIFIMKLSLRGEVSGRKQAWERCTRDILLHRSSL